MTSTQLLSFLLTAVALLAVPGPSVVFAVSRGLTYGRLGAVSTVAGNFAGAVLQAAAVAAGLGAIVATSTVAFTIMKLTGGAYLVYLGIKAWRERRSLAEVVLDADHRPARSTRRLVRDGFIVGATNPKATLFFMAVLPQFVRPEAGHTSVQLLVLGITFCLLGLVTDTAYGVAAGTVRGWVQRRPRQLEAFGGAGGVLMVALGVRLTLTSRHT
jgi:threonine/homoserine/homoserine lactone efflux protein